MKNKYFIFSLLLTGIMANTTNCMMDFPELGKPILSRKFEKKIVNFHLSPCIRYLAIKNGENTIISCPKNGKKIVELPKKTFKEEFSNNSVSSCNILPNIVEVTNFNFKTRKYDLFEFTSHISSLDSYTNIPCYAINFFYYLHNGVHAIQIRPDNKYIFVTGNFNERLETRLIKIENNETIKIFNNAEAAYFSTSTNEFLIKYQSNNNNYSNNVEVFIIGKNDVVEKTKTLKIQEINKFCIRKLNFLVLRNWNKLMKDFRLDEILKKNKNPIIGFSKDTHYMHYFTCNENHTLTKIFEPKEENPIWTDEFKRNGGTKSNVFKFPKFIQISRKKEKAIFFIIDNQIINLSNNNKTITIPGSKDGKIYNFEIIENQRQNKKYILIRCYNEEYDPTSDCNSAFKVYDLDNLNKKSLKINKKRIRKRLIDCIVVTAPEDKL